MVGRSVHLPLQSYPARIVLIFGRADFYNRRATMDAFTRQYLIDVHELPPAASGRDATELLGSLIAAGEVDAATVSRAKSGCFAPLRPSIRRHLEQEHALPRDASNAQAQELARNLLKTGTLTREYIAEFELLDSITLPPQEEENLQWLSTLLS